MKYSSIVIVSSVLALSSMSASAQINEVNDAKLSSVSGQLNLGLKNLELRKIAQQYAINYAKSKAKDAALNAVKNAAGSAMSAVRPK